jgi:hypothetical protein
MQLGDQDNNYAALYHTNLHLVLATMYLKNRYKHLTQMECKRHDEPKTNNCNVWNILLIWPKYINRCQPKYNHCTCNYLSFATNFESICTYMIKI